MTGRRGLVYLMALCLALLAGCSSPPKRGSGSGQAVSGGGYYKDDGPGDDIPANIHAIPDAVPRIEPFAPANMRSYVVFGKRYTPIRSNERFRQTGVASWYGRKFHGNKTANGETYNMYAMTAAHPTLPLPSYARVTNARTNKSVIVRINDRGPFHSSRIIDLSYAAAAKLGLIGPGSGQVIVEAITHDDIRRNNVQPASSPPPAVIEPLRPATPLPASPQLMTANSQPPASDAPDALETLIRQSSANAAPLSASPTPAQTGAPIAAASAQAVTASMRQPASTGGEIYLQYGAFSASSTADQLAQSLNADIASIEPRRAQVLSADALHRVQVGPYASRTEAVNAALRIQQLTGRQGALAFR
ncbi:MAG: septal ring lytic transglycosylase RlpA family protein [Candidimonas sp.]